MSEMTTAGGSVEDLVFEAVKRLLKQRVGEQSESQAWVTGSEIAHVTGIDKDDVLTALEDLRDSGLLHIKQAAAEGEIEVLGVNHGPAADSLEEPVDEEP